MHTKIRHPGAAYNKAVEQPGVSGAKNLAMTQHISYASFGPTPTFEPFKPRILTLGDTVEHCERCGGGIIVAINNNPWAPSSKIYGGVNPSPLQLFKWPCVEQRAPLQSLGNLLLAVLGKLSAFPIIPAEILPNFTSPAGNLSAVKSRLGCHLSCGHFTLCHVATPGTKSCDLWLQIKSSIIKNRDFC